jgi:acyl-CoA thioesterase FadM
VLGSYLLRAITVGLGSVSRKGAHLLDEIRTPMRVWPTDVDTYGHLNNGRFLTLMDMGRFEHVLRTGLLRVAMQRRWAPVVGSATVRFRRELRTFAQFELVTCLRTWDEKWFYYEHRFEQAGTLCALAYIQGVAKKAGRTVAPQEMFSAVGYTERAPTPPETLAAWMRSLEGPARPHPVFQE